MYLNSETYNDQFIKLMRFDFFIFLNVVIQYTSFLFFTGLVVYSSTKLISMRSDHDYMVTIFARALISAAVIVTMFSVGFIAMLVTYVGLVNLFPEGMMYLIAYIFIGFIVPLGLIYYEQLRKLVCIELIIVITMSYAILCFMIAIQS